MLNGMGRDGGPASTLDQAMIPETVSADRRTWTLAWYNLVLDAGHAIGALGGAIPAIWMRVAQVDSVAAHRATFLICAAATIASIVPYQAMTAGVEVPPRQADASFTRLSPESRRKITRLALLFGLDSVGGGFLNSALIAYWFFQRYGTSEASLAVLFFAARALNAVS